MSKGIPKGETDESIEYAGHVTYAAGYITRYLEDYASRTNVSPLDFTLRVSQLIYAAQSGEIHRADDPLPALSRPRRKATKVDKTSRKVALVSGSRRKTQSVACHAPGCEKKFSSRAKYVKHRDKVHPEIRQRIQDARWEKK